MKRKAIIPLLLGLGVGLATVKLAVDTIRKAQAANKTAVAVKVVWAKEDIDAHEAITAEMIETIETGDSRFAPAGDRFESVQDVVGRVPSKPIPQKTPVLKSMLTPEGTPAGLVGKIPTGFRAVSVKIDEVSGVAYQIKPGDWVDVIVVMDVATSGRGGKDTIAEVILQHIQVGAIGNTTAPGSDAGSGKVKPAKSATLLVPEEDVPKLHLAGTRGKVTLAMRGEDDLTAAPYHKASMNDVIPGSGLVEAQPTAAPSSAPGMSWGQALVGFLATPGPGQRGDSMATFAEKTQDPYSLLVVRGSAAGGTAPAVVERLTFENANSSTILEATEGLPTRASSRMRVGRGASVPTAEPGSRPDQQRSPDADDRTGSSNDDE